MNDREVSPTEGTPEDYTEQPPDAVIDELQKLGHDALQDASSIASKRLLGKLFERELDELHTPEGSSYFSEKRETRGEEEKKQREERQMMGAVAMAAGNALREHGIRVKNTLIDEENMNHGTYVLKVQDNEGRRFDAKFGLELAQSLVASGGHSNLIARMGQAVARQVIAERERYLERMQ